jgi:hypothetical protein
MNLGQGQVIDEGSPGQRARLPELHDYCRRNNIEVKGDATKDEILRILDVQPLVNIPTPKRVADNPDLGSKPETDDEKRVRLEAQLAELKKPKIMTTKIFEQPQTQLEMDVKKLELMQHHERKKELAKMCEENGFENRFPGPRGKGPEVLAECIRIRTEIG